MKYLIVIPDYTGSCIQDEFEGEISLDDLDLPKNLIQELNTWHKSYREIIPLNQKERIKKNKEIEKLDLQGLELVKKINDSIPGGAKIKYFSEGKLKYLDTS